MDTGSKVEVLIRAKVCMVEFDESRFGVMSTGEKLAVAAASSAYLCGTGSAVANVNSGVFGGCSYTSYENSFHADQPNENASTRSGAVVCRSRIHTRLYGDCSAGTIVRARGEVRSLYGIVDTKGQRVVNKRAGRASTLFAAYAPPDEYRVENERLPWMLLATPGDGVEAERWVDVVDRPVWLDYQLCRHNDAGEVRWTWRRTSAKMAQLYAEVGDDLAKGGDMVPLPGRCNVSRTSRAFTVSGRSRQSFSRSR